MSSGPSYPIITPLLLHFVSSLPIHWPLDLRTLQVPFYAASACSTPMPSRPACVVILPSPCLSFWPEPILRLLGHSLHSPVPSCLLDLPHLTAPPAGQSSLCPRSVFSLTHVPVGKLLQLPSNQGKIPGPSTQSVVPPVASSGFQPTLPTRPLL